MLKNLSIPFLCLIFLSSCATLPSEPGRDLASRITSHSFTTRRAMILGDGVTDEAAARVMRDSGALVLYCPSRRSGADQDQKAGLSQFMKDVMASLRAMAKSDDVWEVAVAERARAQLKTVLAVMRAEELASFHGKLILSEASRTDETFQAQIKRVFGEEVAVEYIRFGAL